MIDHATRARSGIRRPLAVLVADDSAVMRAMIIRTLRLTGLPLGQVYEAADGATGLRILTRDRIELALVDINMPALNGLEMLERAREGARPVAPCPAVIVVSSDGSDARAAEVLRLGHGFLHKPFAPEALRDAVLRVLGEVPDDQ